MRIVTAVRLSLRSIGPTSIFRPACGMDLTFKPAKTGELPKPGSTVSRG